MNGTAQWLGQDAQRRGYARREFVDHAGRHDVVLGEARVDRDAMRTIERPPFTAVEAGVAGHAGVECHGVARTDVAHRRTDGPNHAAHLVPEHPWRAVQADAAVEQVQVRGAHAAADHVDHDVHRAHSRQRLLLEAQVAHAMPDGAERRRRESGPRFFELHRGSPV